MKKIILFIISFVLFLPHAYAVSEKTDYYPYFSGIDLSSVQSIILLDNGAYLIEGKASEQFSSRSVKDGSKSVYYTDSNGVLQWTATLYGTFYYDGTTSYCTDAYCITSVQSGNWSESANNSSHSGNAAFASVTMVRKFLFIVVETETVNITLTCDASGNLS